MHTTVKKRVIHHTFSESAVSEYFGYDAGLTRLKFRKSHSAKLLKIRRMEKHPEV